MCKILFNIPSSHISNQTSKSYLACICDVHNEGNTPNFGERTGKLIGIDGGNIRLGGCRTL